MGHSCSKLQRNPDEDEILEYRYVNECFEYSINVSDTSRFVDGRVFLLKTSIQRDVTVTVNQHGAETVKEYCVKHGLPNNIVVKIYLPSISNVYTPVVFLEPHGIDFNGETGMSVYLPSYLSTNPEYSSSNMMLFLFTSLRECNNTVEELSKNVSESDIALKLSSTGEGSFDFYKYRENEEEKRYDKDHECNHTVIIEKEYTVFRVDVKCLKNFVISPLTK